MSTKQSDKMAWGVTFLIIGALVLLDKLGITGSLPFSRFLQSPGTYFLAAGIAFLIYKSDKTLGLVFTVIGVIIHSDTLLGWIHVSRQLMLPVALLAVGVVLVLSNRK